VTDRWNDDVRRWERGDGGGDPGAPEPSKGWQLKIAWWMLGLLSLCVLYLGNEYIKSWKAGGVAQAQQFEGRLDAFQADLRRVWERIYAVENRQSAIDADQKATLRELDRIAHGLEKAIEEARRGRR
jgi:hypothetical protein